MDIWHRIGRILRISNLGTLIFFVFNIALIISVFDVSGHISEIIIFYIVTILFSLSPIGERFLAFFAGAKDIKRIDIKLKIIPLVQYVLDRAKQETIYNLDSVNVMIIYDDAPNAFALGRKTICFTQGLLNLPDDLILGVLAHEVGHLAYGHTVVQLLIGGGNILISGFLCLLKFATGIVTAIIGLLAIGTRDNLFGLIAFIFTSISASLLWTWTKICKLFLMWSMRQNEYIADEYAYKIGFGMELAKVLDQCLCDAPHSGFFKALYNSHPYNDDRVIALQNLGVPYSRHM